MSAINTSLSIDMSFVRPEYFFITGLTGTPYSRYYYIFLFCMYIIAVIGNSAVLVIIAVDRRLHIPKYITVFNLALADIGQTNSWIPNMVKMFLFDSQYISYNACLANMYFVFLFNTMQSYTLVVLAYDRFVAICFPLRYYAIVNNRFMFIIISAIWIYNASFIALTVCSITRLSFCKTNVIQSFFCDHGPVYKMACNDNSLNSFLAKVSLALYLIMPILIVLSYLGIFISLSKITTWESRLKALKTCVSHLLLVSTRFCPIIVIYIIALVSSPTTSERVISTSLAYIIPPVLNPIIYVLNTSEIKDLIRKVFKNRSGPM